MRQLVLILPVAWAFTLTAEKWLVWVTFPLAEVITAVVAVMLYLRLKKRLSV